MHHLVADACWSDEAVLSVVAAAVLPQLVRDKESVHWIIDDTGLPKKGKHSVGVAHQYCGQSGKQDNCRVAVSLSIATARGSLPVGFRLYLPREWTDDVARCHKVGVPDCARGDDATACRHRQPQSAHRVFARIIRRARNRRLSAVITWDSIEISLSDCFIAAYGSNPCIGTNTLIELPCTPRPNAIPSDGLLAGQRHHHRRLAGVRT